MRVFLIVADSFGCGALPDAPKYHDQGSHTLRSVVQSGYCTIPHLEQMGLFHIPQNDQIKKTSQIPCAAYGRMAQVSAGKDTVSGHWELAGLISPHAMPLYPQGFPKEIIDLFEKETGRHVLCNLPYSGTQVLCDYGEEHLKSGALIVYTSGDSVFQIAAHEDVVNVEQLYHYCRIARKILTGPHAVGRVIARPFIGTYPHFTRTAHRRDFGLLPHGETLLDVLSQHELDVIGIGKIEDIFAGRGITQSFHTKNNEHGLELTIEMAKKQFSGLCFVNLVDFDSIYGHRRDPVGYAQALSSLDQKIPELFAALQEDDICIFTADHGCDPAFHGTDHTREYVPLLIYGKKIAPVSLGTRTTFADLAKTIAQWFGCELNSLSGHSFASLVNR